MASISDRREQQETKKALYPTYLQMAAEAIVVLKQRWGSSATAIVKFVEKKYGPGLPQNAGRRLRAKLRQLTEEGKPMRVLRSAENSGGRSRFRYKIADALRSAIAKIMLGRKIAITNTVGLSKADLHFFSCKILAVPPEGRPWRRGTSGTLPSHSEDGCRSGVDAKPVMQHRMEAIFDGGISQPANEKRQRQPRTAVEVARITKVKLLRRKRELAFTMHYRSATPSRFRSGAALTTASASASASRAARRELRYSRIWHLRPRLLSPSPSANWA